MKSALLIRHGEQLLIAGDFEAAREILAAALLEDPNNPEVYYLLGDALCKLARFNEAIAMLRKANRLQLNHPQIVHLLGWALFMNDEVEAGRALMEQSLTTNADDEQIYADLAVLEMKSNNFELAKIYVSLGKKVAPDDEIFNTLEAVLVKMIPHSRRLGTN